MEFQARAAHRAGARHLLLFVDHFSNDLLASCDRLSREGIELEIVREAREAGDHLHPDEMVLVMAAQTVAEPNLLQEITISEQPTILGVRDVPEVETLERIDGFTRWSGLALLRGELIRNTAQGIGDWDFASTLLRRALQTGVGVEVIDPQHANAPLIRHIVAPADSRAFNRHWMQQERDATNGLIDHYIWSPIASFAMQPLFRYEIESDWFAALAGLLTLLTLASVWLAPIITAPALFLTAGLVLRVALRLSVLGLKDMRRLIWIVQARILIGALALAVLAHRMVDYGIGWGYMILALWVGIEFARLSARDPWFLGKSDLAVWRAAPDMAALVILIAHLANHDILGLELLIGYALVSQWFLIKRPTS